MHGFHKKSKKNATRRKMKYMTSLGGQTLKEGEQPVAATLYSLFLINYYNEAEPLNAQGRTVQAQTYVYYNSTAGAELTAFEADLLAKVYTITSAANAGAAVSVEKI
jgi:hypothetical protein